MNSSTQRERTKRSKNNFIGKRIGDQYYSIAGTSPEKYVKWVGEYPNKSKYVRVEVFNKTPKYLDTNGNVREGAQSASLPAVGSGSQGGGFRDGRVAGGGGAETGHRQRIPGFLREQPGDQLGCGTPAIRRLGDEPAPRDRAVEGVA